MTTKILAIDDSKTIRLAIKITFAAEDADVTSVSKGSDAVARAKQMGADVVLLDVALASGEPSGYEVCRTLKSDPATSGIPVVLLVSNQDGVDEAQMSAAGGDDWIVKPFDSQELIDKVGAAKSKGSAKPTGAAIASSAPAATAAAAKPAAAERPAAAPPPGVKAGRTPRPATRTQMGMPTPASSSPTATPAPAPATKPTPQPAVSKPAVSKPVRKTTPKPARSMTPAPKPSAAPARAAATPASRPAAPSSPTSGAGIPIAIPIPFTSASTPTAGMIERIAQAAGPSGVDPKVAEALASLSREVVERIVWEVVPELAESIIRESQAG